MPEAVFLVGVKIWVKKQLFHQTLTFGTCSACQSGTVRAFRKFLKKQFVPPVEVVDPVKKKQTQRLIFLEHKRLLVLLHHLFWNSEGLAT